MTKRKIMQMSNSSFIVTLPKDWTNANNINKGEVLDVEELGNDLLIKGRENKKIDLTLDLSNLSLDLIWRNLVCAYRKGADKVNVTYKNEEELSLIMKFIPDLMGWAIVEMEKNKVIIKDIIPVENDDFEKTLDKVFLLVIDISEKVLTGFLKQDKTILNNIPYYDYNINKFTNLCLRVLNLKGLKYERTNSLYKIISTLEEIADQFRALAIFAKPQEFSSELISIFKGVNSLLHDYYKIFYKFENLEIKEFYDKAELLLKEFKSFKRKSLLETEIYASLFTIFHLIKSLSEENMVMSL